ncbi:unnamed protein product, partial [Staurois parvus]
YGQYTGHCLKLHPKHCRPLHPAHFINLEHIIPSNLRLGIIHRVHVIM